MRRRTKIEAVALLLFLTGCGSTVADTPEEKNEEEMVSSYKDIKRELEMYLVDGYWGEFQVAVKRVDGQDMYCFTLSENPDLEILVNGEQTAATVINGTKTHSFSMREKIIGGGQSGYSLFGFADVTGDGVEEFIYESITYDDAEDIGWAEVNGQDILILELETMRAIEVESVSEVENIPEEIPVEIEVCQSEENVVFLEEGAERSYIFSMMEEDRYGGAWSKQIFEPGDQALVTLQDIHVGQLEQGYGAYLFYCLEGGDESYYCLSVTMPLRYDKESGMLKYDTEQMTQYLTSECAVYAAKKNPGEVRGLEAYDDGYLYEVSEVQAVSEVFSSEIYYNDVSHRKLYEVSYPGSDDKSEVYLVTLQNGEGYLYVYLEGKAFDDGTGGQAYKWQAKEIAYTDTLPEIFLN